MDGCSVVDVDRTLNQIQVRNPTATEEEPPKSFTFDSVFDWKYDRDRLFAAALMYHRIHCVSRTL